MTITYRFVRQEVTSTRTSHGDASWISHHTTMIPDVNGDWIEKDYGNGTRTYRMAIDCNQKAIAKMRGAA